MISNLLIIAVGVFLLSLILSYRDLRLGLILYFLAVPLMHKEVFSLGVWDLLPIRLIAGGLILATFAKLLVWLKCTKKTQARDLIKQFFKYDPFLILLVALWLVRALSIINTANLMRSLSLFGFYTSVVLVYAVYRHQLLLFKDVFYQKIVWIYLWLGVITGVFAVYQFIMRLCCRLTIGGVWVVPGYTPRLGSTFWDVNHYGGFLVTLIPLYFAHIFIVKKNYQRLLMAVGTVLLLGLLFMTKSRSAWIGITLGLSLTGIIYYWNHLKKPLISVGAALLLGLMIFFGYTSFNKIAVRAKIARFMHARLDSTDTHLMLLNGATEIFFDNLYIGSGYGNFDEAFRQTKTATDYFDREPKLRATNVPPHSVWGEVLAETGGFGIVLYTSFSIILFASVIQTIFTVKSDNKKYLGIGILGSITSMFSAGLFYSYNMEFYWVMIFMAIGYVLLNVKKTWDLSLFIKWWHGVKLAPYLIIIPPALFLLFINLGSTTLIDWDEAIYATVAKNIVQTGQWLSLRWDDMSEYWFEKPPLYMWLTALVFKITKFNSFGARFVSTSFGLAGILLTYKFAQKLYNRLVGIFSALILMSTVHYLYYARNGMLDVMATFFIVSTVFLFYLGRISAKRNTRKFYMMSGATLGLGMMTKAVVGLIPIPIIAVYLLFDLIWNKKKLPFKNLTLLFVAFLFVAAPWHVYSAIVHGHKFVGDYFLDHILKRGLQGFGHEKPWWWFLEVIKVSFRIWLIPFAIGVFWLPFKDRKKWNETVLLGLSIFIVLVFFSVSRDKLLWYITPIYPFMAIVSARFLERFVTWFNSLLKSNIAINAYVLRAFAVLVMLVVSIFHVILVRDRIYYPDFNHDKVALVKIHNNLYPIKDSPDKYLYYSRIQPPVLHFYSDHRIKPTSKDGILHKIEEAKPNQSLSFLIPAGMYYGVRKEQSSISAPLVLEIKGAVGEWMLIRSKSRVEVLRDNLIVLDRSINPLWIKSSQTWITYAERRELSNLLEQRRDIVKKLTDYGYPPAKQNIN